MKNLVILGSTGSIGVSTLEIMKEYPNEFNLYGISGFSRVTELKQQILEFKPKFAYLPQNSMWQSISWQGENKPSDTTLLSGEQQFEELVTDEAVDIVLVAIVGIAALKPTYQALRAGKTVLLANKEALVCAGKLLIETENKYGGKIIPIDSEHCALYQLLSGRFLDKNISSLTLTASGGPFFQKRLDELKEITPQQAVKHPRWSMGAKISIDSATMVNKALEVAEAFWLFNLTSPKQVDIVIHPESIIHGLVNFTDGVSFAQLSIPDMRAPISYALKGDFTRFPQMLKPLNLAELQKLTFHKLDDERFPAPKLMYQTLEKGKALTAVYNCANETAVEMFMKGDIKFLDIINKIESAVTKYEGEDYQSVEELVELHERVKRVVYGK